VSSVEHPLAAGGPAAHADLDPEADGLILASRQRVVGRLADRDRAATALLAGGFMAAALATSLLIDSARSPSLLVVLGLAAAYVFALRIEFEIGTGSAIPTQLVLVPMLFLLPVGAVPLVVAACLVAGYVLDARDSGIHLDRVLLRLVNAWHALGPALVLGLAGESAPSWNHIWLYGIALVAQWAFDFCACATRDWLGLGVSPRSLLRYWKSVLQVDAALAPVGLLVAFAAVSMPWAFLAPLPLLALLGVFAQERRARIDHALELSAAYRGTALLLGDVVEADDAYTGSHSRDVVDLVLDVCDELGVDPRGRRDAEFAALLHDVGKIRIPSEIINKPGKLDAEERAIIETHTVIGEELLKKVGGLLGDVGTIVRSCHERWDGAGYPDGLAGESIPLVARIVCACDALSAMTTTRSYRAARSVEEALEELQRCAGTQFDPRVVEALVAVGAHTEVTAITRT
jgi:HD-GYP domain-containing protein (c-di-GMP phosphodiesterase class II)